MALRRRRRRINPMRHKKSLPTATAALLYEAAAAAAARARSIFLCGIKKSCSDIGWKRGERGEDAHVVVMVEDSAISVLMCIQWTNIMGKKGGYIFISSTHKSLLPTMLRNLHGPLAFQFQRRLGLSNLSWALFRSGIKE